MVSLYIPLSAESCRVSFLEGVKVLDQKNVPGGMMEVYSAFKNAEIDKAGELLKRLLYFSYNDADVVSALKCVRFWQERESSLQNIDGFEAKGDYLLEEWFYFIDNFIPLFAVPFQQGLKALRCGINHKAYRLYCKADLKKDDGELHWKVGRCLKGMGTLSRSISCLEKAFLGSAENSSLQAELADCYALIGDERRAKLYFREAFFIDPTGIDVRYLVSGMIQKLISLVESDGYGGTEIKAWIPVYGVISGILDIARELSPLEFGRLNQRIYELKNDIRRGTGGSDVIPHLINCYFRFIDHMKSTGSDKEKIKTALLDIKWLNADIYSRYQNTLKTNSVS